MAEAGARIGEPVLCVLSRVGKGGAFVNLSASGIFGDKRPRSEGDNLAARTLTKFTMLARTNAGGAATPAAAVCRRQTIGHVASHSTACNIERGTHTRYAQNQYTQPPYRQSLEEARAQG